MRSREIPRGDNVAAAGWVSRSCMGRLEGRQSSALITSLLISVAFLGASVIDCFLVPPGYIVSSLYAIPILLTARRFCPRMVAGMGLLAVSLNLLNVYLDQTPLDG